MRACVARGGCQGACVAGGHAWQGVCGGGMHRGKACIPERHAWRGGGACVAGETATAADGTHPTGMHSCSLQNFYHLSSYLEQNSPLVNMEVSTRIFLAHC